MTTDKSEIYLFKLQNKSVQISRCICQCHKLETAEMVSGTLSDRYCKTKCCGDNRLIQKRFHVMKKKHAVNKKNEEKRIIMKDKNELTSRLN